MKNRAFFPLACGLTAVTVLMAYGQSTFSEEEIRKRVSRTQVNLRSFHTAFEAYRVDNNAYPTHLAGLTTPIAYLPGLLPDEFPSKELPEDSEPVGPNIWFGSPDVLKMNISPEERVLVIYSVGPDEVDDGGLLTYDPTNGVLSTGDIRRTLPGEGGMAIFLNPVFQQGLSEARGTLKQVEDAVITWVQRHDCLPEKLEDLIEPQPLLDAVPEDPLDPGNPVRYERVDTETAFLYSVGIDGDDDYGTPMRGGVIVEEEMPDGDIVRELTLEGLRRRAHPWSHANYKEQVSPYMMKLLELKERTGRDNALVYYVEAENHAPGLPGKVLQDLLERVGAEGWSEDKNALRPWLELWEKSHAMVLAGASIDAAFGIGSTDGAATPVPNFLSAQLVAKSLAARSDVRAYEGDHDTAIDDALAVLTMGRDFQSEDNALISHFIGIAIRQTGVRPLGRMVRSGELSSEQLRRITVSLRRLEATTGTLMSAFRVERDMANDALAKMAENKECQVIENELRKYGIEIEDVPALVEELKEFNTVWWGTAMEEISKGWVNMNLEAVTKAAARWKVTASAPASRISEVGLANIRDIIARMTVADAQLRLVAMEAEMRRQAGRPESLEKLMETPMTVDPFTNSPLQYTPEAKGAWSVGPDGVSDGGILSYDPTNGTLSAGDIMVP